MKNTIHTVCRELVELCRLYGVKRVVLSPGSRNAPLLLSFAREENIAHYVVVDERVAAFVALGMCMRSNEPVALVCTSGTALLNYAPAVAEAYYHHLPLIVISADRPEEWIDQDDSQTIRQQGVLSNIVKKSYHIPSQEDKQSRWHARRLINEALQCAQTLCRGPVHINVPLREPLYDVVEEKPLPSIFIENIPLIPELSRWTIKRLSEEISRVRKVMILGTMSQYLPEFQDNMLAMAELPQVVVLTETLANVRNEKFIPTIDRVLTTISEKEKSDFAPDLLITFGGAPVSRIIKEFIRQYPPKQHWRVGCDINLVDTMQCVTHRLETEPDIFFAQMGLECKKNGSNYATIWNEKKQLAAELHNRIVDNAPWCDLRAFSILLPQIPADTVLHLSNGTSVRYVQLFDTPQVEASYCNRGVSGIDGSTSTALGSSLVDEKQHLLITGDMSFAYDIGALATRLASPRFKIIVIDNGGGGIFRFIKGPSDLPELEELFEVRQRQPIEGYASIHGLQYYHAGNETELKKVLPIFFAEQDKCAILAIETPNETNADVLRKYMNRAKE